MTRWLDGPVAAFDLETTGVDVERDRVITACVGYAKTPGTWTPHTWLIKPGVPIPATATAVHGITDEDAAQGENPTEALARIAETLQKAWGYDAPVVGHNIVYDLTLLDREMRRHLNTELTIGGPVIDTLVIDKYLDPYRKGSRRLPDVCQLHGVPLDGAHSAEADAFAALRLAWLMIHHSDLAELPLDELHNLQVRAYAEQRTSFHAYLRRQNKVPDDTNTIWPLAPYPERTAA